MDANETREKILNEAFKLFIKNGYEKTSLNDIAQMINITKPALYYHFKNKDDLFLEVTNMFLSIMDGMFHEMVESTDNIRQFLENLFFSIDEIIKYYNSLIGVNDNTAMLRSYSFVYEAIKKFPDFKNKLADIYKMYVVMAKELFLKAVNEGIIRDDLDYDTMAYELNVIVEGLMLMSIIDSDKDLNEVSKSIFENYWKRIKK